MYMIHERHIPVMKQGKVQSCVGMALIGAVGSGDLYAAIPEDNPFRPTDDAHHNGLIAKDLYRRATLEDRLPVHMASQGSTIVAAARVGKRLDLIGGFRSLDTVGAVVAALEHHPAMWAGPWYADMDDPDEDGDIEVSGQLKGGHALVLDGIEGNRVRFTNSWGPSWGQSGSCYIPLADLEKLFAAGGSQVVALYPSAV